MRIAKKAQLPRLHFGESDAYNGKPLYEAIVYRAKEVGIAGATTFRGLEGFGETAELHRRRMAKKAQPVVVTIVDTAENLARLVPEVQAMMDTGMIAISEVDCNRIENPRRRRGGVQQFRHSNSTESDKPVKTRSGIHRS
jgi:PII-like signaling protein